MALDKNKLVSELTTWLSDLSYPTVADSMTVFIDAYETYAMDAIDVSGDGPAILNTSDALDILNAMPEDGTSAGSAQVFEDALIEFWEDATFLLTIPPAGTVLPEISAIVTTSIAGGSIQPGLESIFDDLDPAATPASKALEIADVLHPATLAVIVTCIGTNGSPPPPVLPVLGPIS